MSQCLLCVGAGAKFAYDEYASPFSLFFCAACVHPYRHEVRREEEEQRRRRQLCTFAAPTSPGDPTSSDVTAAPAADTAVVLTAAATAAVATAKELLAQNLRPEPSPILPNPVQIAADPSVVPEESGQQCSGGAISTGSTISGSSGGCGDGSGGSSGSSGKEHDNSSGVLGRALTWPTRRRAPSPGRPDARDGQGREQAASGDPRRESGGDEVRSARGAGRCRPRSRLQRSARSYPHRGWRRANYGGGDDGGARSRP